ncbi:agamous-like MADS-box protein AGL93 [Raphanus sativus]|uniref:Agamous-like MADS-box protein AGL93 n=1 Tax=Raphanus sativus TaxID=3726 RepID=A0A6J0LUE6_RAPSA|nr:agamous-like MADS-box protein AGL93 [Raphanus sativus]
MVSFSSSSSDSSTKMKKKKLSVTNNQTRFKKPFLLAREKTMLKKALELTVLCDNEICVLHYDREGNLVNTMPEDQSQVTGILDKYRNLSDGEKLKKSTNLSQFYNKKLVDEKKRSLTDAEERKRFTKKVGDFKGSLVDQFHILQDRVRHLRYSQDHHHHQTVQDQSPFLDVVSDKNHNFPEASSYGFFPVNDFSSSSLIEEENPLMMNFCPPVINDPVFDHQQQIGSLTNPLLMSGDASTSTEQDMSPPVYNYATTGSSNQSSKFSMFLFNHETATFTRLPNSVSSSFDQGLTPPYTTNLGTALHGAQGFNFGCSNNLNSLGFNFGCNKNLCT